MTKKTTKVKPVPQTPLDRARKRLEAALEGTQMSMNGLDNMSLEELLVEAADRIEYMMEPHNHYCSCGVYDY